ncbi:MAG: TldD/PmbA family protein [bacterium]
MEDLIRKALKACDADYAEVHMEEILTTSVNYAGKEIEEVGTHTSLGGNVRAFTRGGWGFVSFNDISKIEDYAKQACAQSGLVEGKDGRLAVSEPIKETVKVELADDPAKIPLEQKERVVRSYNDIILRARKIKTSRVRYRDSRIRRYFFNTEGTEIIEERVYCGTGYFAIARDGNNIQVSFDSVGGTGGFNTVLNQEADVERVAKEAVDLLEAEKVEAGKYTVIADQLLSGVFAHEAFGHLSESDFLYRNERVRKIMELGKRFGPDELSIVDDATLVGERGYYKYDDEGVRSQKTFLIRDGILVGRLHSRETAGRMGEEPTGNARCISYRFQPIVRMSCTFIEPGGWSFEEMIQGIERGIYAKGAYGGQTQLEMFTFSARRAYLIEKGKVGPLIRDVVLSGNVFETLKNIEAIGNDLKLHGGLGGCGKEEQWPLPTSTGSPHVKIKDVIIGGK